MAGTQTAGYDMVIQFSEDFYERIIGTHFDMNNVIPQLLDDLGVGEESFSFSVTLDPPLDLSLPSASENPLDITIEIGNDGVVGEIRMVVGVVVDRSSSEKDVVSVDFDNHLYYAIAKIGVFQTDIRSKVQHILNSVPLLPIPVDRSCDDAKTVKRADFKIVHQSSYNVLSTMLTFGGGVEGNSAQLQSFVSESGAIGLYFRWLCRLIIPKMEESLGIPTNSFELSQNRCSFSGRVLIDDEEDIYLKTLSLSLKDGYISLDAKVTKSGTCYDASGSVGATLKFVIENSRLKVVSEVEDPDVDVDIPWWCYFVGAITGAIVGALVYGVIGSVVGLVLIPLVMWITEEVVEGTFDTIADNLRNSINDNLVQIDVSAFGIEILFQDVFIDDVIIDTKTLIHESFPVVHEGVVRLHLGEGLDLDKGVVNPVDNIFNDINWKGKGNRKYLETGCKAAICSTKERSFEDIIHLYLYGFDYQKDRKIPLKEFGYIRKDSMWFMNDYDFIENKKVWAVRTNGGRFALLQVIEVEEDSFSSSASQLYATSGDWIELRYKTFEKERAYVEIQEYDQRRDKVQFLEAKVVDSKGILPSHVSVDPIVKEPILSYKKDMLYLRLLFKGRWIGKYEYKGNVIARLKALASGFSKNIVYRWKINSYLLEQESAEVTLDGIRIKYQKEGANLTIFRLDNKEVELLIEVEVGDDKNAFASATRCIRKSKKEIFYKPHIPSFKEYKIEKFPISV